MGFCPPLRCLDLTKTFAGRASAPQGFFDELKVNDFAFFLTVFETKRKNRSDSKPFLGCTFCCSADSCWQKKILNYRLTEAEAGDSPRPLHAVTTTFYNPLKTKANWWLTLFVLASLWPPYVMVLISHDLFLGKRIYSHRITQNKKPG